MIVLIKKPVKTKTGAPVSLDEVKQQLNIEVTCVDDDAYLAIITAAAIDSIENDTNSDILNTTNILEYDLTDNDGFSCLGIAQSLHRIVQAPYKTLTKIEKSTDGENFEDIDPSKYKIYINEDQFLWFSIIFLESITAKKLRFTFSTGYTDTTTPKVLKQAILLRCADLYDPERVGYTLNNMVENKAYNQLISKHKRQYY